MRLNNYLIETKDNPYGFDRFSGPQRNGNSIKAWKEFIVQTMLYHEWRFDSQTWTAVVGDNITKTGLKALQQLEKEGKVTVDVDENRLTGQSVYKKGKLYDWGGSEEWTEYKVTLK